MNHNLIWISTTIPPSLLLKQLPEILSVASACNVKLEVDLIFEELKYRQILETDEDSNQITWNLDGLDYREISRPKMINSHSNFSFNRFLFLTTLFLGIFSYIIQNYII